MNIIASRLSAVALLSALAFIVFQSTSARSQVQVSPAAVPIGVSSSGSTSTAWFHEPSSRQAIACQTVSGAAGLSAIQCVVTKLPQ